ncbi:ABC transporter permease [Jiangella alkaliphila]|uniref:Simple sugar transport system permease protein n=1 Tax=Jiangella alkaliphila TaxID=419479 RepID=A0A1H2IGG4_9ACTN|nr:ABC transporter permease [Jiangella alkaliphila]SDU43075.1 simple sugar transport system permease protein [Jiangella alkaliphila]
MTETTVATERPGGPGGRMPRRPSLRFARLRDLALLPAIVVLLVIGALVDPVFFTSGNLINVLQQQTELSLLVLAEVLILITGRLDLSLESTVGLAPAIAIALVIPVASNGLGTDLPAWTAVPLCLLAGVLIGCFNGLLVVRFGLSAFIVTLGMLIVLRGLQIGITEGQNLFDIPESFTYLGSTRWLGLPASVWICAVAFALGMVVLGSFRAGRALYAVGGNEDAARAGGIRVGRVVWGALIAASTLAALAGVLMTGRLGSVAAAQGEGMIFTVFAAAVIGGVALSGGKGTVFGALCGVLVLGLVTNILTLGGVSAQWIQAIYGGIILAALVLARLTTGRAQD